MYSNVFDLKVVQGSLQAYVLDMLLLSNRGVILLLAELFGWQTSDLEISARTI